MPAAEDGEFGMPHDAGSTRVLLRLISLHPFWALYLRTADIEDLKFRGRVIFVLEVIFLIIYSLAILAVIVAVVWKTLAPFPNFWK
jgi:hypothetical protein